MRKVFGFKVFIVCILSFLLLTGCAVSDQESIEVISSSVDESKVEENVSVDNEEAVQKGIPAFVTKQGEFEGVYSCGNDNYEECYYNVTAEEVEDYKELLVASGYTKHSENTIAENTFAAYVKDGMVIYLSWYHNQLRFNVVYGSYDYLPSTDVPEYTNLITPTVTQIGRGGAINNAPGLSLIVQMADGSYVIIDGGPLFIGDEKKLMDYLNANNPDEGKPKVTWMFTHAHGDHMDLAMNFLAKYHSEIELTMVCYNFPDFGNITIGEKSAKLMEGKVSMLQSILKKKYPNSKQYIFHTGEKLLLPGCEIEFLKTHEDFWPNDFKDPNETSSAWRMTIEDKTMLILGDCLERSNKWMADVYGSELKSDILQVTHHGFNGGCVEIYECVDPEICFWPIDQYRFDNDERILGTLSTQTFNAWLRDDSVKERIHYAASDTVTLKYPELKSE